MVRISRSCREISGKPTISVCSTMTEAARSSCSALMNSVRRSSTSRRRCEQRHRCAWRRCGPDCRVKPPSAADTCALAVPWTKRSGDAVRAMWNQLWRKWTVDKPAAFGDLLWDVLVVQFAAWLDRLTVRQVIALIPVAALILAYLHHIPVHPGVMLLGDLLAYIDIFSMLFLLGILSRASTILFVIKQGAAGVLRLARSALARVQRLDLRHRRERRTAIRKRPAG